MAMTAQSDRPCMPNTRRKAITFNIKVDVFHSKRLFQKLIFTICIFIIPSPTLARKRKKPLTDGSFKSL